MRAAAMALMRGSHKSSTEGRRNTRAHCWLTWNGPSSQALPIEGRMSVSVTASASRAAGSTPSLRATSWMRRRSHSRRCGSAAPCGPATLAHCSGDANAAPGVTTRTPSTASTCAAARNFILPIRIGRAGRDRAASRADDRSDGLRQHLRRALAVLLRRNLGCETGRGALRDRCHHPGAEGEETRLALQGVEAEAAVRTAGNERVLHQAGDLLLQRLVGGIALLARVGGEEAGGARQPIVAIGGADLLLGFLGQATGRGIVAVAGALGVVAVHRVNVAQDALVDDAGLLEVLLVRGEEPGVRGLGRAGVPTRLVHLCLPGLVEPAGRFAALDSGGLAELHPGAAHAERGAVLGLRPLPVSRRLDGGQRHRRKRIGDRDGGLDGREFVCRSRLGSGEEQGGEQENGAGHGVSSGAAVIARAQDRREHLADLFLIGRRGRHLRALEGGELCARVGQLLVEILDLLAVGGDFLLRALGPGDLAIELGLGDHCQVLGGGHRGAEDVRAFGRLRGWLWRGLGLGSLGDLLRGCGLGGGDDLADVSLDGGVGQGRSANRACRHVAADGEEEDRDEERTDDHEGPGALGGWGRFDGPELGSFGGHVGSPRRVQGLRTAAVTGRTAWMPRRKPSLMASAVAIAVSPARKVVGGASLAWSTQTTRKPRELGSIGVRKGAVIFGQRSRRNRTASAAAWPASGPLSCESRPYASRSFFAPSLQESDPCLLPLASAAQAWMTGSMLPLERSAEWVTRFGRAQPCSISRGCP